MYKLLRLCGLLLAAALFAAGVAHAADSPQAEVAVAMRYFQQTGTSHAHLYLYRADGKLLRQLTDDNHSQDQNPLFAPDGETIVFTRKPDAGGAEYFSIEPRGGNLHPLSAAPTWYTDAKNSSRFLYLDDSHGANPPPPGSPMTSDPSIHRSPDGSVELVLGRASGNQDEGLDDGRAYLLRDLKSEESVALGKIPGFVGLEDLLALDNDKDRRFLLVGSLRVAFFGLHLDSMEKDTVFALDLDGRRLVRLSPNWATPFPLPGEAAFLTFTENLYVPFGDGKRTANCSYIERWGADLKAVRYAKAKAAGECYGASMYRPDKVPTTIYLRSNAP